MTGVFLILAVLTAVIFAFRYVSLRRSLQEANRELKEIERELEENRFLHLPSPESDLERFIGTVNEALEEIRRERRSYAAKEREFQRQIENISHDLRTPLTVILGYLKLLEAQEPKGRVNPITEQPDGTPDQERAFMLGMIERNARIMERLVRQFYDYSRIHAGDYETELLEVDVCRLLRETLVSHYQVLEAANLSVTCDLPERPVTVWGETGVLERIFSNLFQNAGRYASRFLQIALEEEKTQVTISFANDTRALSAQDIPHLFDRFYMQDISRSKGGTGLGLTVAKGLAEAIGGALTAQMEAGQSGESVIRLQVTLKRVL